MTPEVRAAFDAAPATARQGMLRLRALVQEVAAKTPQAGPITEALRWGQPAWRSAHGTTLRTGPRAGGFALYAHCRTTIIPDFRTAAGAGFSFEGNRAVLFRKIEDIRPDALSLLICHALTYHRRPAAAA